MTRDTNFATESRSKHYCLKVGPDSWFLLKALSVDYDWLCQPIAECSMSSIFQEIQSFVNTLRLLMTAREGRVKLHLDYTAILTDNPGQRASILKAVEKHRQKLKVDFAKPFKKLSS